MIDRVRMLHWAEAVDSYRVFPRLFLAVCLWWAIDLTYVLLHWYFTLPAVSRGIEATGFASVVFVAVVGFLKMVFSDYSKNGRDWNQQPTTTTVERASVTTTQSTP